MPLINRIEVSNFINSELGCQWNPKWPHAVFELLGFNTIINMPNGSGKTAMVSTALCCLSGAGRQMSKLRNIFFAPKSYGIYTHVRLQVTLDTDEGVGFDLFSGAPQGLQMVFGVFGRSGDEERHNFYSYAGTFEDCPVNQPDPGNLYRKNLISDKDFEDRLATMTGRFPANTREATDTAWKAYVQKWGFDTESIEQQLTYQLNAGGEGESSYFAVNPPQNMSYSAGVFYKHLAPQLLTDVMGGHGEDDEKGIEDTIHEKAMRVVHAQMQCDRQKEHLDEAKLMLDAIDRIREAADEVAASKNDILECRKNLGVELAVLKNITVDSPIPGLPPRLPKGLPAVAEYLVLCGGVSYLSDRGLAAFTGEEPKIINQRSMRLGIHPVDVEKSQLIEIACDLKIAERDDRGKPNKFYNQESVFSLLGKTENFLPGITRESAIADIEAAFAWANGNADTNPARLLRKGLEKERNDKRAELEQVSNEYAGLLQEKARLLSDKEHASGQLAEFLRMERSGLFTSEELASPENTGILTAKAESEASETLSSHRQQVARSEQVYVKWQDFIAQYGVDADPEKVREELAANEESSKESLTLLRSHRSILIQNRQKLRNATTAALAAVNALGKRLEVAEETLPLAEKFDAIFPGEDPTGLKQRVMSELSSVRGDLKMVEVDRAGISAGLKAIGEFKAMFGEDIDPGAWLENRLQNYNVTQKRKDAIGTELEECRLNLADLEKSSVAPGQHARAVSAAVGVPCTYLHDFVETLSISSEKKSRALTLFSALLFAPVLSSMEQAVTAALNLAEKKLEFPVFIADDLAKVCQSEDITGDTEAVRNLFVGVRTRSVECLLDPDLVEREKKAILEKLELLELLSVETQEELKKLSPDASDSRLAGQARDALEKDVLNRDALLNIKIDQLLSQIPRLEDRASLASVESIDGVIRHREALAGALMDDLQHGILEKKESLRIATMAEADNESEISQVDDDISTADEIYRAAQLQRASCESDLLEITSFAKDIDHGPDFMARASEIVSILKDSLDAAKARNKFNFRLAQEALRSGFKRPEEIDLRIKEIDLAVPELEANKTQLSEQIEALRDRIDSYGGKVVTIDLIVAKLSKMYRKHRSECISEGVDLSRNDLFKACGFLRVSYSIEEIIHRLAKLQSDVESLEEEISKNSRLLKDSEDVYSRRVKHFEIEFSQVRNDRSLKITEHFGHLLDQAKDRPGEISSLLAKTQANYEKERLANAEAQRELEYEWEKIGEWLTQFTQRLPSSFDLMKRSFAPKRDQNRKLVQAGFEIKGEMISMDDVRGVLEDIVNEVTHYEQQSEESRKDTEKTFRQKIRDKFYQRVILGPGIKVCIPTLGDKLELEKKMASSGQMVAISLLWIVKLADFVTERERSKRRIKARVEESRNVSMKKLRGMESQFVFVDGAFSHLSDAKLINSVLEGISKTKGNFQLIVTMHNENHKHNFTHFPTLLSGRKIGERYMYVLRSQPVEPGTMGSHYNAMDIFRVHCVASNKPEQIEKESYGPAGSGTEGTSSVLEATGEQGVPSREGTDRTSVQDSIA